MQTNSCNQPLVNGGVGGHVVCENVCMPAGLRACIWCPVPYYKNNHMVLIKKGWWSPSFMKMTVLIFLHRKRSKQ